VGCAACDGSGYRGRAAAAEVLLASAELSHRVAAAEPPERIADAARAGGMRSLWESGLAQVRHGVTSVDELLRVLERPRPSFVPSGEPRAAAGAGQETTTPSVPGAAVGASPAADPRVHAPAAGARSARPAGTGLPRLDDLFDLTDVAAR
jgi:hypothetical protein